MIDIFKLTYKNLKNKSLKIVNKDLKRPWGGFFDINEDDFIKFVELYFGDLKRYNLKVSDKLSAKILIIAPQKRLSWQYHHRRSEIWKVNTGKIKVVTSHDDIERKEITLKKGDEIRINQGERHRIIGIDKNTIIAEIWIHSIKDNPSDENDIVRVQDDFNRN